MRCANILKCVQFRHTWAHRTNTRGLVIQESFHCPVHLQEWRGKQGKRLRENAGRCRVKSNLYVVMIEFFSPNSRALLHTFQTNCPHGSHFAQMGSHFAQNSTTNPRSLLSRHKSLLETCTFTKHHQPHPKTPLFLA